MHTAVRGALLRIVLSLLGLATPAAGKTITVGPGSSIQHAVDFATTGDTVMVLPGTYHEGGRPCPSDATRTCAVVIDKDGIALVGRSSPSRPVLLVNSGRQDRGIEVAQGGASGATCLINPAEQVKGSLVRGFTVNGFDDDGILLMCVDNWKIERCSTNDNLEYGIFPSHCGPGRVTASIATGSNDTASTSASRMRFASITIRQPTTSAALRSRTPPTSSSITIALLAIPPVFSASRCHSSM